MPTISKVLIDTNVFVALKDITDSTHKKALQIYKELKEKGVKFYTTSDIIAESLTVISMKLNKKASLEFLSEIGGVITEIFIDEYSHKETRKYFKRVKSKNISFVDCSSVVAMKRNKIAAVFSFDEDFKKMGVKLASDIV